MTVRALVRVRLFSSVVHILNRNNRIVIKIEPAAFFYRSDFSVESGCSIECRVFHLCDCWNAQLKISIAWTPLSWLQMTGKMAMNMFHGFLMSKKYMHENCLQTFCNSWYYLVQSFLSYLIHFLVRKFFCVSRSNMKNLYTRFASHVFSC